MTALVITGAMVFSCEGPEGPEGPQGETGTQGASSLISLATEPAGDNCEKGGFKITVGIDTNGNGTLDADEITGTAYACNGDTGDSGLSFLINTSEEPAGDNCQFGGFKIEAGLDENENGTLDEAEITQTDYLCNGVSSTTLGALATVFPDFSAVTVTPLISSLDELPTSNGEQFILGGSADGAGMILNPTTGNYELMVNCEDHYSVARITLNADLKPIKGDYMLNSGVSDVSRQCSGTMWEAAIHGGDRDLFISSSETFNYTSRGIDPLDVPNPTEQNHLAAFGQFAWENNVPLPQVAYPGKTVVVGGDDDSDDETAYGQVAMYMSESGDADLTNGKVYVLRMEGATGPSDEGDIAFGTEYAVEFVEIEGGADLTLAEMGQASLDSNAFQFMRVEDLDYGKGSAAANRIVYFAVTGRGPGRGTFNDWGTGYKLVLDENNPLKGKMTQIISGNTDSNNMDGNISLLQSPDNICVTENFIYWQEDPNSFDRNHQAYIWQTDLNGDNAAALLQIDINEGLNPEGETFSGEFGAMFDISDKVGEEGTFILCLQPHYWVNSMFEGVDGHFNYGNANGSREDDQGSQLVILRNVPR